MTASDTPDLVLRNTSLTMRERFTPARSCSTLTRICANFRLVRFSASVSSPRGGFFFRLAGFLHCRLIALESGVLEQGGPRWIGDPFLIGYLFVMRLARVRLAQVVNPLPPSVDDDHVLIAMLLLAPTVKKGLFFRVFRPLAPPLGGVDDQLGRFPGGAWVLGKVRWVPLGEDSQVIQSRAQNWQQPMNPIIHPGQTQVEEFGHDRLERIGLEVDQQKQELILGLLQSPFATPTNSTLARLAFGGLVCGVDLPIRRKRPANHVGDGRCAKGGSPRIRWVRRLTSGLALSRFAYPADGGWAGESRPRCSNQRSGSHADSCSAVGASPSANSPGRASRR
jgi:hypothetical protein